MLQDNYNNNFNNNGFTPGQIVGFIFLAFFLLLVLVLIVFGMRKGWDHAWLSIVTVTTSVFFNIRGLLFGRKVEASFTFYQTAHSYTISMEPPSAPPLHESTHISMEEDATFHSLEPAPTPMDVDPPNYSDLSNIPKHPNLS